MNLKALGYRNYKDYLSSNLWRKLRSKAIKTSGGLCCCCGEAATEVHHRNYDLETLKNGGDFSLVPLCNACHHLAEFDTNGRKRTTQQANRFLDGVKGAGRFNTRRYLEEHNKAWKKAQRKSSQKRKRKNKDKSWTSF